MEIKSKEVANISHLYHPTMITLGNEVKTEKNVYQNRETRQITYNADLR